ncbi:MAG: hypothetical protein AAGH15_20480 [Myxococcota bacterium]
MTRFCLGLGLVGTLACSQTTTAFVSVDGGEADAAATSCVSHPIADCSTSNPDIGSCGALFDGAELAPRCPELTRVSLDCRRFEDDPSYCYGGPTCADENGCFEESWIGFDLGRSQTVTQLRFIAGWWRDRPRDFELWVADDPAARPGDGATRVVAGRAEENPWECVEGEPCTDEVPDGCCPDGRDQPQVVDQTALTPSCELGNHPKFDIVDVPETEGRYWFFVIKSGYYDDRVWLHELELRNGCSE